ncbi:MAG: hypothetical protein WEE89_17855 [Gemmatimonadota bacterium]
MPGVNLVGNVITMHGTVLRGNRLECNPNVFIDGRIYVESNNNSVDDLIIPDWLGGVEVYSREATSPVEYRRGDGCGVVLFWTKDPERGGRWTLAKLAAAAGMAFFAGAIVAR